MIAAKPVLQEALLKWYGEHGRDLPWRHTRDPYLVLVSEIMLQQTQVDRVVPKFLDFTNQFPNFESLSNASPAEVFKAWSPLGYNRRAVRLHRVAKASVANDGLPGELERLRELEGVGEYTAAAIGCFAFNLQVSVVDTNVSRIVTRLAGFNWLKPADIREMAADLVPSGRAYEWNQAMMDLGALVCSAAAPKCEACPISNACVYGSDVRDPVGKRPPSWIRSPKPEAPFRGSRRYYRGRIVERLRGLLVDDSITLVELGMFIKDGFVDSDLPWLEELLVELERDGLVKVSGNRAALPLGDA